MLISEAVQLILQAGALGSGREIFVLEMGKPVKIIDLANKMIKLAGYNPDNEIKIKLIGIRPGEKLSEELIDHGEKILPTIHKKIKLLSPRELLDDDLLIRINRLCREAIDLEPQKLRQTLFELANTSYSKAEKEQSFSESKENKSK